MPVMPSINIDNATADGTLNLDTKLFRFVSSPLAKIISGGEKHLQDGGDKILRWLARQLLGVR